MKNLKKKLENKQGFTLIELLVVVAIIAILALIVLLALNPVEMARRSRDSRRLSDLGTIRKAIDLSLSDGESLVNTGGWVTINTATDVTAFPNGAATDTDISKYISVVPADPYTSASTPQIITTTCGLDAAPSAAKLIYEFNSDGNVYVLRARLESKENCNAIDTDGKASDYYELGTAPGLTL